MKNWISWTVLLVLAGLLAACGVVRNLQNASPAAQGEPGMMPGMGPGSGMHARHSAVLPPEYTGKLNPLESDAALLEIASATYTQSCATCHGDGGMGDGPASASLDPAPSPIAHTSMMLGDDYLFWRISEGGMQEPFNSVMPAWKDILDEQTRWQLVIYLRALGSGQVRPLESAGGAPYDPAIEAAQRAEMLARGIEQGVITKVEADTFNLVHAALDEYLAAQPGGFTGRMQDAQDEILAGLVKSQSITQEQADVFKDVHERLVKAGLMQ